MKFTHNNKIIRDFSRAAHSYDTHAILQRKVADRLFKEAKYTSPRPQAPSHLMLDIGCGTGYFHELLRKNKIYLPLVQLDISHGMCKVADSYASPPEYGGTYTCTADMHSLPFADKSFASIFSSMTLQWSEDLPGVFQEIRRVLQSGGRLDFSIVGDGSLFQLKETFLAAGEKPRIHKFKSQPEVESIIKESGFIIDHIYNEPITINFKDVRSIMHSIKKIGASYKGSSTGFKGKNYLAKLEKGYKKFKTEDGLPLSWNIIYVRAINA